MTRGFRAAIGGEVPPLDYAVDADVLVVGAGAAGLAAAIGAAAAGVEVVIIEKADGVGGTTAKSGGVLWIADNQAQESHGLPDDRVRALAYMARVSAPERFDPDRADLGLESWERELLQALVERGPQVLDELQRLDALSPVLAAGGDFPDYHWELPEQGGFRGRALQAAKADGTAGSGVDLVEGLVRAAVALGVQIMTGVAFEDLLVDDERVVGVVAGSSRGQRAFLAARGVVLAAGGFTHDDVRRSQLPGRVWGGCAAPTNTGDTLPALEALDVPLANMDCAWWDQVAVEHTLGGTTETRAGVWVAPGDSSVIVDLTGRRVVNEKAVYNTRAKVHLEPDGPEVLLLVLDDRARRLFSEEEFAYPVGPADLRSGDHLISADSWPGLVRGIQVRLDALSRVLDNSRLPEDFATNLASTVASFAEYARKGSDPEFDRGGQPIERFFHGAGRPGAGPNPTMAPFADQGPYHAVVIGLGTLDTKGGPRTDADARVLDAHLQPVPGLYAAGNCAASPSAQGYWAAGATIGPALVQGFSGGRHAAHQDAHAPKPSEKRTEVPTPAPSRS